MPRLDPRGAASCSTSRCSPTSAQRAGEKGPQEWLSFFFKSPVTAPGRTPVHDLFQQQTNLHAQLRRYAEAAQAAKAQSAVG